MEGKRGEVWLVVPSGWGVGGILVGQGHGQSGSLKVGLKMLS